MACRLVRRGFAACGRRPTLPTAARRRKVHSTPFPPGGENCVCSLAPPLPGEPASLGFVGSNEGLGKTPPGTAPDEHFVLIVAYPTPFVASRHLPLTGSHPLKCAEHFRRAKSGVLGYYPVRPHWGPEWGENWDWCDSMPAPELAEPTSLVRNMGYLIRPLRGHLPLKGKAGDSVPKPSPLGEGGTAAGRDG